MLNLSPETYERLLEAWKKLSAQDQKKVIDDVKSKVQSHLDTLMESAKQEEQSKPAAPEEPLYQGAKRFKPFLFSSDGEPTSLRLIAPHRAIPPDAQETPLSNILTNIVTTPSLSPALRHQGPTPEELSELASSGVPLHLGTKTFKKSSSSEGERKGQHIPLEPSLLTSRKALKLKKKATRRPLPNWALGRKGRKLDAAKKKKTGKEKG